MIESPIIDIKRNVKLVVVVWEDNWPTTAEPGQAEIIAQKEDNCVLLHSCPGCGRLGGIKVGYITKPESPSWVLLKGDKTNPTSWTLSPSIHCKNCCGWHGYLKEGIFSSI